VSQTSLLSLASVPNLNGKLTVVTHASYNGLPALAKIISPIVRLHVLNDDEVDFDTRPANWVLRVELMKYHFVRRQAPGAKVVYVELDQLFLPGAGRLFEATFDNHAFDAAFTFNLRRDERVVSQHQVGLCQHGRRAIPRGAQGDTSPRPWTTPFCRI